MMSIPVARALGNLANNTNYYSQREKLPLQCDPVIPLTGEDFKQLYAAGFRNFLNLNLSNAKLTGTNFTGVILSGGILTKTTKLRGANFTDADLTKTDLTQVDLDWATFTRTHLTVEQALNLVERYPNIFLATQPIIAYPSHPLKRKELESLYKAGLRNFRDVNLSGVDLTGIDLRNTNLANADLTDTDLKGADLRGADITNAYLMRTTLTEARITLDQALSLARKYPGFAILSHQPIIDWPKTPLDRTTVEQLYRAGLRNFRGINLSNVDLTGIDLRNANLANANLIGTNLTHANLTQANLMDADFTDANLWQANLTKADLTDAKLIRTNLTAANLTSTTLLRAIFKQAIGAHYFLLRTDLDPAICLHQLMNLQAGSAYSLFFPAEKEFATTARQISNLLMKGKAPDEAIQTALIDLQFPLNQKDRFYKMLLFFSEWTGNTALKWVIKKKISAVDIHPILLPVSAAALRV